MNYKRNEKTNVRIATALCIIFLIIFAISTVYIQEEREDLMKQNSEYLSVIEECSVEHSKLEEKAKGYKNEIKNYKSQIKEYEEQIKEYKEKLEATTKPITTKAVVTTRASTTNNTTKPTENKGKTNVAFYLSDYERRIVECIVMGESGSEPYNGQVLVAQCILNACLKDGLQPSSVRRKYQYSGWNNNPSQSVKNAVSAVFDKGYKITNERILYFYAPKYCTSKWHESQKFVCEVGGHRFFAQW